VNSKCRKFYDTRIDRFLVREGIGPAALARRAKISRQTVASIRAGTVDASEDTIVRLLLAVRHILKRQVKAEEMFDLGEQQGAVGAPSGDGSAE